jgi:predicted transcriptional regulator
MFKSRRFKPRSFHSKNNDVPLFTRYYIPKLTGIEQTRQEVLNNAAVSLQVSMCYSYGHEQAAYFLIGLVKKNYKRILSLDDRSFKRIVQLMSCNQVHELNPVCIHKTFKKVLVKPIQSKRKISIWTKIEDSLSSLKLFPILDS